jgi:hypothetical protein
MILPPEARSVARLLRIGEAAVEWFETARTPEELWTPGATQQAWERFVNALAGRDDVRH